MTQNPRGVPDAWDDDYETFADSQSSTSIATATATPPQKPSRAERKAQHAEANKQLWNSAENPETFHFVETRAQAVPLTADFKPPLQLLSRKPKPVTTRANGAQNSTDIPDDEEDSDEERRRADLASLAERQLRAQREREEKQRRYQEVRERLFGTPVQSPDAVRGGKESSGSRSGSTGRKRGGGGGSGGTRESTHSSSAEQSPARAPNKTRQLYDPDSQDKPGSVYIQKRIDSGRGGAKNENQPVRQPNGPGDSGFGFAGRGTKANGP